LYQYWTHTEIIGRLGWFDRVFVSPSNHRVHHGQNDYCIDRNYGGILIIWDRLFGTFEDERPEPIVYGVRTPLASVDPLWSNLHYYALIWRDFRAARGIDAKLDAIFAPPSGWRDEKLGHFEPLKFKRYEIKVARSLARYVTVQYAISVLCLCAFLYRFPHWTATQGMLAGAWIVAGLVALAAMMAGKRWGTTLEVGRWIAVIPLVWMLVG
jgi:hypothetical protein